MEIWYVLSDGGGRFIPFPWCYWLGKSWKSRRHSVDAVMCGKAVNLQGSCSAFVAIAGDYGGWAKGWFCGAYQSYICVYIYTYTHIYIYIYIYIDIYIYIYLHSV